MSDVLIKSDVEFFNLMYKNINIVVSAYILLTYFINNYKKYIGFTLFAIERMLWSLL